MIYLITQMVLLLAAAAVLGGLLGWLVRGLRADRDMQVLQSEHERLEALAQEQAGHARNQLREAEARLSETNDELGAARARALQQREELDELRAELAGATSEADRLRQAARNQESELEAARNQVETLQSSLAATRAELEEQERAVAEAADALKRSEAARQTAEAAREGASDARRAAVQALEDVQAERDAAVSERDMAVSQRDAARVDRDGAVERRDELADLVKELHGRVDELESRSQKAEEVAARAAERSRSFESTRSELEARLAARGEEVRRLTEQLAAALGPDNGSGTAEAVHQKGPARSRGAGLPAAVPLARGSAMLSVERPSTQASTRTPSPNDRENLQRIKGVGPRLEQRLNELGFYRFEQIAGLTADEIEWLSAQLGSFPDRIRREDWIGQASALADDSTIHPN